MKKLSIAVNKKIKEIAPQLPAVCEMMPLSKKAGGELSYVFDKKVKSGEEWLKENPQLRQTDGTPLDPVQRYVFKFMKEVNHEKVLRQQCLKLKTEVEQFNFINQYIIDIIELAEIQPDFLPEMII